MVIEWTVLTACLLLAAYSAVSLLSRDGGEPVRPLPRIARQLAVLEIDVSVPVLLLLLALLSAAAGALAMLWMSAPPWFGLIGTVATALASLALLKHRAAARVLVFERQLADSLDVMYAATESGYTVEGSLRVTAAASPPLLRREFDHVVAMLGKGRSIEEATARMAALFDAEVVRLVIQLLSIGWQDNATWLALLRTGKAVARQRVALRTRLAGKLSGSRYAVLFVAALPYLLVPFFLKHDPEWLRILLTHNAGPTLLLTALALQLLGFFWMQRILRLRG